MKLPDIKLEDKILYRLKINHITMQCAILFKTTAEPKSQQQSIICICVICWNA